MADGQVENSEINHRHGSEKSSVRELQNALRSKEFQKAANAYRILDMAGKHSINLFSAFPDSHEEIRTGHITKGRPFTEEELEIMRTGLFAGSFRLPKNIPSKIRLDQEQKDKLVAATKEGGDLISDAKLFTCSQNYTHLRNNQMRFLCGHTIMENEMPLSVPVAVSKKQLEALLRGEVSAASIRGLFIEMRGAFSGTYILLLDPGRSRWLYDWHSTQGEKKRFAQGIISALNSDDQCQWGRWIKDSNSRANPQLAIVDHDYNIESVIPIR